MRGAGDHRAAAGRLLDGHLVQPDALRLGEQRELAERAGEGDAVDAFADQIGDVGAHALLVDAAVGVERGQQGHDVAAQRRGTVCGHGTLLVRIRPSFAQSARSGKSRAESGRGYHVAGDHLSSVSIGIHPKRVLPFRAAVDQRGISLSTLERLAQLPLVRHVDDGALEHPPSFGPQPSERRTPVYLRQLPNDRPRNTPLIRERKV